MMTLRFILTPLVAFMLPLVAASSADAGIIVTVGRPSPVDVTKKPKATATAFPIDADGGDRMCIVTLDGRTNCPQVASIDPMTGLPSGWMCRPLGSNRFYCDEPGRGAGADGEGGAGGFDGTDVESDDVDDVDGDDAIEAFGCDAGGASSGFGVLAAFGALGVMGVRRRAARG